MQEEKCVSAMNLREEMLEEGWLYVRNCFNNWICRILARQPAMDRMREGSKDHLDPSPIRSIIYIYSSISSNTFLLLSFLITKDLCSNSSYYFCKNNKIVSFYLKPTTTTKNIEKQHLWDWTYARHMNNERRKVRVISRKTIKYHSQSTKNR